jgi:ectoine hydroxylase-related dioxygenase (phytanoyl-CoA dioxygenase family)
MVTDAHVAQFRADGFTTFESLVDDEALVDLRASYDRILAGEVECGPDFRMLGGITRQVMAPSRHLPAIQDNPAYKNAQQAASKLLGCDEATYLFDMMIFKPAGHPESTPWHQDLGYYGRPFSPAGLQPINFTVQFWIAVDDADVENGCMHFVPEAHTAPMREHYVYSGDVDYEGRLLAIRDPETALDLDRAVPCPLPAGGATAHAEGTPHYTPPNTSKDRNRRAYIVNFQDPTKSILADR